MNFKAFFVVTTFLMTILLLMSCGDVDVSKEANDDNLLKESTKTTGSIKGVIGPEKIGASVKVVKEDELIKMVGAKAQGEYLISDLPAGEFNLEISAPRHFTDISLKRVRIILGQTTPVKKVTLRSWADAATFTGSILDAKTGQPVENASIRIECATSVCSDIFTTTEAGGSFQADIWPDLASNIIVSKIGYKSESVRLEPLGKKGNRHLEFQLENHN